MKSFLISMVFQVTLFRQDMVVGQRCQRDGPPKDWMISILTPWKTNMGHTHGGLEDHFPF